MLSWAVFLDLAHSMGPWDWRLFKGCSLVCAPAFESDHGLPVPWSSVLQGEELKAISRV